jgi:ribosome-associated heat shock protein Hsp15
VGVDKVRVDKWLWAARMYKTRSMATDACSGGHVLVNGEPAKPSRSVVVGDSVHARTPGGLRELEVVALGDKRGPAKVAQTLYIDHTPPPPPTLPGDPTFDRGSRKGRKGARPTKKERRKLNRERDW